MIVCIPVTEDRGLQSPADTHFGAAPLFAIVDTATRACRVIANGNAGHAPGACNPLVSLEGESVDIVITGRLGGGALTRLLQRGVRVGVSSAPTVAAVLDEVAAGHITGPTGTLECSHEGPRAH
jgi:predicted Fe-Mo cluster-binding NifX family protein